MKSIRNNNIFKTMLLIALMVLLFKIIGFIKQAVIAYYYGATNETDLYFIAYGFIISLSEALVKAMSVSMISVYTVVLINEGRERAQTLVSTLLELFLLIALGCTICFFVFAPQLSAMLLLHHTPNSIARLSFFIRALSVMSVFIVVELIGTSILDSERQYYVPRTQSLIYSISVMLACILFSSDYGVVALIGAQYSSSLIYSVLVWYFVKKYVNFKFVRIALNDIYIKRILLLSLPLLIGNSAIQINQVIDRTIASNLADGAVSALSYCHTIAQLVTNILIVNIGNILFAHFNSLVANNQTSEIKTTLAKILSLIFCILTPIMMTTVICAEDIVRIIFYRGKFSDEAVALTSIALLGYAISFPLVGIRDILTKSMYAYQNTHYPMITSLISIACNILLSIALSKWLGVLGITIGASIAIAVGTILNLYAFKKVCPTFSYYDLLVTFAKGIPAILLSFLGVYMYQNVFIIHNSIINFIIIACINFLIFEGTMLLEKEKYILNLAKLTIEYCKKNYLH